MYDEMWRMLSVTFKMILIISYWPQSYSGESNNIHIKHIDKNLLRHFITE